MSIKVDIELLDDDATLTKMLKRAIIDELKRYTSNKESLVIKNIKDMITSSISQSPEFISLSTYSMGELAPEFGFVRGSSIQRALLLEIENLLDIKVDLSNIGKKPVASISLDMNALASSSVGSYTTSTDEIEWLKWLLTAGTSPVIYNWQIEYNLTDQQKQSSRSKQAIMVQGGDWRVPGQYAGVINDNFITRAIQNPTILSEIEKLIADVYA